MTDEMLAYIRRQCLIEGLEKGCETVGEAIIACTVRDLNMTPWPKGDDAEVALVTAFLGYNQDLPIRSVYDPDTGIETVIMDVEMPDLEPPKPLCSCKPFTFAGKSVHAPTCEMRGK